MSSTTKILRDTEKCNPEIVARALRNPAPKFGVPELRVVRNEPLEAALRPPRLRTAVRAAIDAHARSGRMLDAALAYAAHGFPVFPLDVDSKRPIPKRDPDPTGKFEDGIPGTGGIYKATTDPMQIHAWWDRHEYLIALPMGARSGVWAVDVDTGEDHADGVAEWDEITAQHDQIVTREHRSATGGPHLIFNWNAERPIHCSKGILPKGIDVKGQGGYIAMPPSIRKGRSYTVFSDIDPIDAPEWLTDLILQGRSPYDGPSSGPSICGPITAEELHEIAEAMSFIPNPDLDWNEWTAWGLALFAASGGQNFEAFDAFSQKASNYDPHETRRRWEEIKGSPPNRTGKGKIFKAAREHGWVPRLRSLPGNGPGNVNSKPDAEVTPEAARAEIKRVVRKFLDDVAVPESEMQDPFVRFYFEQRDPESLTRAVNAPTGSSKTQIATAEVAAWTRATKAGPLIYAVPMHRLSERIDKQFAAHGVNARIFYGRDHADPERHDPNKSGDQQIKMCLNEPAVAVATRAHADITKTCCVNGKKRCVDLPRCGYYRQQEDAKDVQVWVVASNMLFHAQRAFGKPVAVIIDEAFWQRGLRGIEQVECEVPLASLLPDKPLDFEHCSGHHYYRALLSNALRQQGQNGPVERRHLETTKTPAIKHKGKIIKPKTTTLTAGICERAIAIEWQLHAKLVKDLGLEPGMSQGMIARVCTPEKIDAVRHARNIITLWKAVRQLLNFPEITVCGRLLLKQLNGQCVVQWRGVADISKQARVPTLLLDATLPDQSILQVYHPQVEVVVDLKVAMPPSVHIRQVLDAPTSSNKLNNEKHLEAVWRYILQRWHETGRQKTLIVCQLKVETWLIERGLPEGIHVEHYNNVSGLDDYRDVRLTILVGRTAPGPAAVESMAAALTGQQPEPRKPAAGEFIWYAPTKRGIRLRDGRVIETTGDLHPDAVAEPIRWQTHEAELVQAFGRARALNRSPECPLDVDLLVDTALHITVDEVVRWRTPSLLIKTAADESVMLNSPSDMVKGWPEIWPNEKAAYRTVQAGVPQLPGFTEITYRLRGPKMNRRTGWFDLNQTPDPHAWIAYRLGPLKPL